MTGIILTIIVISTSIAISARRTLHKVQLQRIALAQSPNSSIIISADNSSIESPVLLPFTPLEQKTIIDLLRIYKQIAHQQGYHACLIDFITVEDTQYFIIWLTPNDQTLWQEQLEIYQLSNIDDPATDLTLYDAPESVLFTPNRTNPLTRISLITVHYNQTTLSVKTTIPTSHLEQPSSNLINTKDLTKIHHNSAPFDAELNKSKYSKRPLSLSIQSQQGSGSSDLTEQEMRDAT